MAGKGLVGIPCLSPWVTTFISPMKSKVLVFWFAVLWFAIVLRVIEGKLEVLRPLRSPGLLVSSNSRAFAAAFFCRSRGLEVIGDEDSDDEGDAMKGSVVRLCDVLPLPLYEEKSGGSGASNNVFTNSLLNRDGGIFDKLPWSQLSGGRPLLKKKFYDRCMQLQLAQQSLPSEQTFVRALREVLGLELTGLLLEVADELSPSSVTLGAAALVATVRGTETWDLAADGDQVLRRVSESSRRRRGKATADTAEGQREQQEQDSGEAWLLPCHRDELVSLSTALGLPVCVDRALYLAMAMDADLVKGGAAGGVRIEATLTAPAASTTTRTTPAAWQIFSPEQFLRMDSLDKRALLRASGVRDLPRPRQGRGALDRALLAVMDDAVRSEVVRLSGGPWIGRRSKDDGEGAGGPSLAASGSGDGSRAELLRSISDALERGDQPEAERLREEFALRTSLRADPTQGIGSYDRFLDQDDWYAKERARSMAPKKAS